MKLRQETLFPVTRKSPCLRFYQNAEELFTAVMVFWPE